MCYKILLHVTLLRIFSAGFTQLLLDFGYRSSFSIYFALSPIPGSLDPELKSYKAEYLSSRLSHSVRIYRL